MTDYKFSTQIKRLSIALIIIGAIGIAFGFYSAPSNVEEAKEILASMSHGDSHEGDSHEGDSHSVEDHGDKSEVGHEYDHDKHVFNQLHNKPWAAIYVPALFFMMISLGVLAFYAIQRASQAGWSIVLFRIMEGITSYLLPGCIFVIIILVFSALNFNHLFIWMDPEVVAHDEIIRNKVGYLNTPFFFARAIVYITGWVLYRNISRKLSLEQDNNNDISIHKKLFRFSAGFLVFFLISESMMSWDWIMSIDPHWFSTLFGWYVFAGMFVSGITTIALITIYLKSQNYLSFVNNSHIHDLGKFMFGVSVFWAYLWFSQFMLIWYSNIPEEVTYFTARLEVDNYRFLFWFSMIINFVVPVVLLMSRDAKRHNGTLIIVSIIILIGHWINSYLLVAPGTLNTHGHIGFTEIGMGLGYFGLFMYVVLNALTKAPLEVKNHPMLEESKHLHT